MGDQGRKLSACFRAASSYCLEINALCETLNDILSREIDKADWQYKLFGPGEGYERRDESGWLLTDTSYSLPLVRRRKGRPSKKPDVYLGYQISLCGDGISTPENEEPLLHVCLWTSPLDFDENAYMSYPLSNLGSPTIKERCLLIWPVSDTDFTDAEWTFSVLLLSLDSSQALLDRIVNPAIALAMEIDLEKAFGKEKPVLVEYDDESGMPAISQQ